MKYYSLDKEKICFTENVKLDTTPPTYEKKSVGDELVGIFNGVFTTTKEIENKKGVRIKLKQIHLKFVTVKGTNVLEDEPFTISLFFENLTYFALNALANTEKNEPVTINIYQTDGPKKYINIGIDQDDEHIYGLIDYEDLPKPKLLATKADGTKIYEDDEVIAYWKKFVKSELRAVMSDKYKPARRSREGKKKDDDDEDEDNDIPQAAAAPGLTPKYDDDLPF